MRRQRSNRPPSSAGRSARASTETEDRDALPDAAQLASLGCGNPPPLPISIEGEVVLDLGSGGGIDVLLSARRVGPTGKAYGLDMTDEMLELARAQSARSGRGERRVRQGNDRGRPPSGRLGRRDHLQLRDQPLGRQASGVSRGRPGTAPGGRFAVTDVVADPDMDEATRRDMQQWTGCIAGALTRAGLQPRAGRRGVRRCRDPRDPSGARPRRLGDHPSASAIGVTTAEIQLNDPRPSTAAGRTRSGRRSRSTSAPTRSSGARWTVTAGA